MKKIYIFFFFSFIIQNLFSQQVKLANVLVGFGSNYLGTLGNGRNTNLDYSVQVQNLNDIVKVSSGAKHTIALKSDGTVLAWGDNLWGQLGDGTFLSKPYPLQVLNLSDVIDISAGQYHSLALKRDGTVWGWGHNFFGEIGFCPYYSPYYNINVCPKPSQIDIQDVIKISGGLYHSLYLKKDGTVWGTGNNDYEQLGQEDPHKHYRFPVRVPDLKNVIDISAGMVHSMALKNDGKVWAWGLNLNGELGDGSYISSRFPVKVKNLYDVIKISAGDMFSLALREDGTVWVWGDNYYGVFGNGTEKNDRNKPGMVPILYGVKDISAGRYGCIAVEGDGDVWTWGYGVGYVNENGSYNTVLKPLKILRSSNVISVSMGKMHQVLLNKDGAVLGRMDNYYGQLGIGEFGYSPKPEAISTIDDLIQVSSGYLFSLGLKRDGTVWAWGYNYYGQLGCGKTKDELLYSLVPVQVQIEDVVAISAGSEFGLALKRDGTVWAWGSNEYKQLGNGKDEWSNISVQVRGLENVVSISAGHFHSLALKSNGTVWAWGYGGYALLGDGKSQSSNVPVQVKNLSNIIKISAGEVHSLALRNDGTVWEWGNWFDWVNQDTPYQVEGLSDVVSIAAGAYHSLALKNDGTVFGWGLNEAGELTKWEHKAYATIYPPWKIEGIPKIKSVYAGNYYSIVEDAEGKFWAFGNNYDGQLGVGFNSYLLDIPTEVKNLKNVISISLGGFHTLAIQNISKMELKNE